MRYILISLLSGYIGAGLFNGLLLQRAIPALNPLGVAYIMATWPQQIACGRKESGCDPSPPKFLTPYLFSFETEN